MKAWERRRVEDAKRNEYTEETIKAVPSTLIIWSIVLMMILGGGLVIAATKPAFMAFERETVQASPQYVEGKRSLLNGLLQDWTQLEAEIAEASEDVASAKRGQQAAIMNRMRDEVDRRHHQYDHHQGKFLP